MLHPAGTVLHNPLTTEWCRVLHADADIQVAELITAPGAGVSVMHRHRHQTEQFDILAGELTAVLDGERHAFGPGETARVPRGTAHCWTSTGTEPLYARVTVSPSLQFQELISATWGLCALGRARPDGGPGLLDGILIAKLFSQEMELCSPPRWVQNALAGALAPAIRASGRTIDSPDVLYAAVVNPERWPGPMNSAQPPAEHPAALAKR